MAYLFQHYQADSRTLPLFGRTLQLGEPGETMRQAGRKESGGAPAGGNQDHED